ncbi:vanadium-dependent haloperoxidase [Blastococcus sp. CT_GayMR19]|uniref:vanadium-dependent haloperoxidase n=1 Tax=Blastococcus sp. CT_GayMR19 TaxID=2559608 RepID=UPI001ADD9DDB|nr:vanadium-dependent haloperoxidase [Blastococcus sp. CT_GayMR19]
MIRSPLVHRWIALPAAAVLMAGVAPAAAAETDGGTEPDPAVVLHWNEIAWRTIGVEGMKPPPVAQLYLGLVSTAVYNAVVTVEGGGEPTLRQPRVDDDASSDVAAATAAHDVLSSFFPASAAALRADYDAWLAGIRDGEGREQGVQAGRDAAAALLAAREGDGRDAPITVPRDAEPAPGAWVPTPPAFAEFTAPWLGTTRPVLLDSPEDVPYDGPDALTSEAYAADFAEVKAMGAATGSARSEAETQTALFWSDNPPRQYQDAMRDRAVRHELDVLETARMFAAANAAGADALVVCWQAKLDSDFWRPLTAIHEAERDGNPDTTPDPAWASLVPAPSYPEYPSGHGCVSSAVATALEELFGEDELDMTIASRASGVTQATRDYDSADAWIDEVVDARIWLGIHFRDAMDDAVAIGREVADRVVDRWFECED